MIPRNIPKHVLSAFLTSAGLSLLLTGCDLSSSVVPDASQMLSNIAGNVPQLMQFVTALAYVMGMFFIYKGLMALKQYGQERTQMSSQHELKGPLIFLAVGAALLYLPSSVQVGLNTFWMNPNPYGYQLVATDQWETIRQDTYVIIQLIGTIAFIRGLVMLTHLGGQHAQPGQLGKAMAHIIAGIFCINLYEFITVIENTLTLSGS